ncbi:MAG: hypothetical protein ACKVTZ_07750 [Bacteroidia bacterium]
MEQPVNVLALVLSYLKLVLRRWWLLLLFAFGFAVMSTYSALKKDVSYTSTTIIHGQKVSSPSDPIAAIFSGSISMTENNEMIGVITSRRMSEMVASDTIQWEGKPQPIWAVHKKLHPTSFNILSWLNSKLVSAASTPSPTSSEPAKEKNIVTDKNHPVIKMEAIQAASGMRKALLVEENEFGMVKMQYTDINPAFVKAVSYRYMERVLDYYESSKTQKARKNYEFLVKRTDSVKRMMTGNMYKAAKYEDQNKYRILMEQEIPLQTMQGESQILNAMYSQLIPMREAALNQMLQDAPSIQILDYPDPPYEGGRGPIIISVLIGAVIGLVLGAIVAILPMLIKDLKGYLKVALNS